MSGIGQLVSPGTMRSISIRDDQRSVVVIIRATDGPVLLSGQARIHLVCDRRVNIGASVDRDELPARYNRTKSEYRMQTAPRSAVYNDRGRLIRDVCHTICIKHHTACIDISLNFYDHGLYNIIIIVYLITCSLRSRLNPLWHALFCNFG